MDGNKARCPTGCPDAPQALGLDYRLCPGCGFTWSPQGRLRYSVVGPDVLRLSKPERGERARAHLDRAKELLRSPRPVALETVFHALNQAVAAQIVIARRNEPAGPPLLPGEWAEAGAAVDAVRLEACATGLEAWIVDAERRWFASR